MYCKSCYAYIVEDFDACPHCGADDFIYADDSVCVGDIVDALHDLYRRLGHWNTEAKSIVWQKEFDADFVRWLVDIVSGEQAVREAELRRRIEANRNGNGIPIALSMKMVPVFDIKAPKERKK